MKLVVLSLLVAVSLAAANAAKINDTQRAFLLGNWLGGLLGKKNSSAATPRIGWWGKPWLEHAFGKKNATTRSGWIGNWLDVFGPGAGKGKNASTTRGFDWAGFLTGDEMPEEQGKANATNATTRGLFNWFDNLFGFGHDHEDFFGDDDDFFGDDDDFFGDDDDFFGDDDDLFLPIPPQIPPKGKPQAPAQGKPTATPAAQAKPAVPAGNATSGLPQAKPVDGNATAINATRAWLLGNWFNHVFGKNKTTRGLLGNLLGNVFGKVPAFGKNKNATTRGFGGWWNFGWEKDPFFRPSRPHHHRPRPSRPSKPHQNKPAPSKPAQTKPVFGNGSSVNSTNRWIIIDKLGELFGKKKDEVTTQRGLLLDNLWNTLFPDDDFPHDIPIRPRPSRRPRPHRPQRPQPGRPLPKPSGAAKATPAASVAGAATPAAAKA